MEPHIAYELESDHPPTFVAMMLERDRSSLPAPGRAMHITLTVFNSHESQLTIMGPSSVNG